MIQELLEKHNLGAYLTLTSDEHLNEYIGDSDQRLQFLTGFSGSNGMAVSCSAPVLYTDSRYYIQAMEQSKEYKLMKMGEDVVVEEYLSKTCENRNVGVCRRFIGSKRYDALKRRFEAKDLLLKPVDDDLVDIAWTNKPERQFHGIFSIENERLRGYQDAARVPEHGLLSRAPENASIVGETHGEKLERVRWLLKPGQTFAVTELDTIAWIFNLRGSDVFYNPVFYSYALISKESARLFVNGAVRIAGVEVHPYGDFEKHAAAITGDVVVSGECNAYIRDLFESVEYSDEIRIMQSQKTDIEIEGFRLAYLLDGVALTRLFEWIDAEMDGGVTEEEVAEKLNEIKKPFSGYVQPSFGSIVGGGSNGAIVHHKAGLKRIRRDELLLIDSGSQYVFGTTDTTRTLHFGSPSSEEKANFTRVLKGQLRAMRMRCRLNMQAAVLDGLARMDLWREKQDFGHSTGHGVGHFLCVHESPPFISSRILRNSQVLSVEPGSDNKSKRGVWTMNPVYEKDIGDGFRDIVRPGQVFSIEPGYYKEGEYGIRIENLVYLKDIGDGFGDVVNLTLVPYQLKLIDVSMLNAEEVDHINAINEEIRSALEPLMKGQPGHRFLTENTRRIENKH